MRNAISSQTYRKADITSDQLGRRYGLIYERIEQKRNPLNLAAVARWYGSQEEAVRSSLEKTEPFAWLKHLDRRTNRSSRSHWFLSALIMEGYVRSGGHHDRMDTVTEDSPKPMSTATSPQKSRSPSLLSSRGRGLGSSISMSMPTDDRLSFEPSAEAKQSSIDAFFQRHMDHTQNNLNPDPGHVPLSPISTRSNDDKNFHRSTPDHTRSPGSSSSESLVESLSIRRGTLNTTSPIPAVSIRPPSSENVAAPTTTTTSIPLTLSTSHGSSSSSQMRPIGSAANQSRLSLKTPLKNRKTPTVPAVADRHSGWSKSSRQDRENSLHFEYETKAQ